MIIFPAIDLYSGKVVRLKQGNFKDLEQYGSDPLDTARQFKRTGVKHIHIVDLEGAQKGSPQHLEILKKIKDLGFYIHYGGGLRTIEDIEKALNAGADKAMIGGILFQKDTMPKDLYQTFGDSLIPSVDVKAGFVVHSGWLRSTQTAPEECLSLLRKSGFKSFLVTAVDKDGTLNGPDTNLYNVLGGEGLIAAGGITTPADLIALKNLGLSGAVVGKALYEGQITLQTIVNMA